MRITRRLTLSSLFSMSLAAAACSSSPEDPVVEDTSRADSQRDASSDRGDTAETTPSADGIVARADGHGDGDARDAKDASPEQRCEGGCDVPAPSPDADVTTHDMGAQPEDAEVTDDSSASEDTLASDGPGAETSEVSSEDGHVAADDVVDVTPDTTAAADGSSEEPDAAPDTTPDAAPDAAVEVLDTGASSDVGPTSDTADGQGGATDASDSDVTADAPQGELRRDNDGTYVLTSGALTLRVDPSLGARVTELNLSGSALISRAHPDNFGSTFWTSPQSNWSWPPPTFDTSAYQPSVLGTTLSMQSSVERERASAPVSSTNPLLSVQKEIRPGPSGSFALTYVIHNGTSTAIARAPWEVTRVKPGKTFFPYSGNVQADAGLAPRTSNGILWLDCAQTTSRGKLLVNGTEGWVAHTFGNLLFVKSFADVLPENFAPGETDVEVYANAPGCTETGVGTANANYTEVEVQGPLRDIQGNASYAPPWTVTWHAVRLSSSTPSDADLLTAARSLAASP